MGAGDEAERDGFPNVQRAAREQIDSHIICHRRALAHPQLANQ